VRRNGAFAGVGVVAVVAVLFLAVTPGYATGTAPNAVTAKFSFPSSSSTVVGSTGFIDSTQVGYFWSAARGDRVSQTFSGPSSVKRAILKVDVVTNALSNGAHVSWDLVINGHVVGHFNVAEGFTGPKTVNVQFHRIVGPSYDVTIRVTNEVAPGEGSMTLAYAGAFPHQIKLQKNA
jgi:hypothetical protein